MTVAAGLARSPSLRLSAALAILLGLAAMSLFVAYERALFPGAVSSVVGKGLDKARNGFNSVATLFAARSPGERETGALASLKVRRQPALHERALPKIRRPEQPATLADILAGPPKFPLGEAAPLPTVPFYNVVTEGRPIGGPPGQTFAGPPGGVPFVPTEVPLVVPPVIVPPSTPVIPPVSAVPEPASWVMMLLGFAAIAQTIRRRRSSPIPDML